MLIDQGAIETGAAWKVNAERLLLTQVPTTLTGVLQARLDGLPAPEKRALQQASVIGSVFWDQALAAIDARAADQLLALVRRELTLPHPDAALEGLREYAFRHHLLHQVTYDTVLKRSKREGHAKVAQWLAGMAESGGLRAGDFLGAAAEHFEQAGDAANAAEFHARAAERAVQRLAHARVLAHVGRALAFMGQADPSTHRAQADLRWRLLSAREATLSLQARRDEQAADLDALAGLADVLDDDLRRADAAWRRGLCAMRTADWAAMESAARQGMDCARRAGADSVRLRALRLLAVAQVQQGEIEAGRVLALQGLAEARSLGLRGIEARLLNTLAIAAALQGDEVANLDLNRQSLLIHRETGDRLNEAIALLNQGLGWKGLGDLAQARRDMDAALQMLRANGDRGAEGVALGYLSALARWQGDETQALALARSALGIAVEGQARYYEVVARLVLGDAELALGRAGVARQAYAQARALALEIDDPLQHAASAGLALAALAEGDAAAAVAALQSVLDPAAAGSALHGTDEPRRIEMICYQALAHAGDPRAADWLSRAHTALMAQAAAISDATLRQGFLRNIPHHREIVAAWARPGTSTR